MLPTVPVKRLKRCATMPTYGSAGAAGADLYAAITEPMTFRPGETAFVPIGIAVAIPRGYVGLVYARSGLACKRSLAPANKVGVIDSDYRGELLVALHNHGTVAQTIEPGERVAQLVIAPCLTAAFEETKVLDETVRGTGGFGSTGTK